MVEKANYNNNKAKRAYNINKIALKKYPKT